MKRARVLVTRPQPGASRTAELLRRKGIEPVVLPLTETHPVLVPLPDRTFDAVAITSANAIRYAPSKLIRMLAHIPVFAVGQRTLDAARLAGFSTVDTANGTAESLAGMIESKTQPGAQIAYLCGITRRALLETRLRQAKRHVTPFEIYAIKTLSVSDEQRLSLDREGFDAALVYSAEGARHLANLLEELSGDEWRKAMFICLSAEIAGELPKGLHVKFVDQPDEATLLESLYTAL